MTEGLYNIAAERWVLYSLLVGDQPFMDACSALHARHFYREQHAEIYAALQASYKQTGFGGLAVVLEGLREVTRPEQYDETCDDAARLYATERWLDAVALSPTYLKVIVRIVVDLAQRRDRLRGISAQARDALANPASGWVGV